MSMRSTNVKLR